MTDARKGTEPGLQGHCFLLIDELRISNDEYILQAITDRTAHSSFRAQRDPSFVIHKVREAGALRTITIGVQKVAEEPTEEDFANAAVYAIYLSAISDLPTAGLLTIDYQGDCARLYADGHLIDDNFYNGRPFQYGLWRLPAGVKQLELRILPIQQDMPVYFPREADTTPGEKVVKVTMNESVR